MGICKCPNSTSLTAVPTENCPFDFGQIQKIAFQRRGEDSVFASTNAITAKSSWTAFMNEDDDTKIIVTPFVEAPTSEGGDAITFGGGNETPGGVERFIGRNPITMTFQLRNYSPAQIAALKALTCEKNLGLYFFNDNGEVLANKDGEVYSPIAVRSIFVTDLMLNGLETPDGATMTIALAPNYSDKVVVPTGMAFNPTEEL